ncbi:Concanavalin A-like lectin/glucanases superfamily protein [uncultured archaeon]|nr:Concanavalin A-like lectin/glucanases superfamily protein [uncultured archaeon]
MYPTGYGAGNSLISGFGGASQGSVYYNLSLGTLGQLQFDQPALSSHPLTSNFIVPINQWSLVGFSVNNTATTVYFDGNSQVFAGASLGAPSNTFFAIGGQSSGGYFSGAISNVQLYNTVISPVQAQKVYSEGISAIPISGNVLAGGLVGWWPLNGDANDYSGSSGNALGTNIAFGLLQNYTRDSLFSTQIPTQLIPLPGVLSCTSNSQCAAQGLPRIYVGRMPISLRLGLTEAANFSGTSSSYMSANVPLMNVASGGQNTVSFWMYGNVLNPGMPFGFGSYGLEWLPIGSPCFGFNSGDGNIYGFDPSSIQNKWTLVTAVFYNGAPSNSLLYVNGAAQPIGVCYGGSAASCTATTGFQLSGWSKDTAYPFAGSVANLQIYNTTLTPAQISSLYGEGVSGMPVTGTGLVGWWPLNGDANDYSGLGNGGSAYGVPYRYINSSYPAVGGQSASIANEWQALGIANA